MIGNNPAHSLSTSWYKPPRADRALQLSAVYRAGHALSAGGFRFGVALLGDFLHHFYHLPVIGTIVHAHFRRPGIPLQIQLEPQFLLELIEQVMCLPQRKLGLSGAFLEL